MDLTIDGWKGVKHTVELGEDDTPAVMRRKVASAAGLPEDGFVMSFGEEAMDEGYDMAQLSAGDTVVLAPTKRPSPPANGLMRQIPTHSSWVRQQRTHAIPPHRLADVSTWCWRTTWLPLRSPKWWSGKRAASRYTDRWC